MNNIWRILSATGTGISFQPKNLMECGSIRCIDCIYFDMWSEELHKCTSYLKFLNEVK